MGASGVGKTHLAVASLKELKFGDADHGGLFPRQYALSKNKPPMFRARINSFKDATAR